MFCRDPANRYESICDIFTLGHGYGLKILFPLQAWLDLNRQADGTLGQSRNVFHIRKIVVIDQALGPRKFQVNSGFPYLWISENMKFLSLMPATE
jgi:hypothetical protein